MLLSPAITVWQCTDISIVPEIYKITCQLSKSRLSFELPQYLIALVFPLMIRTTFVQNGTWYLLGSSISSYTFIDRTFYHINPRWPLDDLTSTYTEVTVFKV